MTIKLAEATIDEQDMDALAEWLKTYPRLTKGPLTLEYEQEFSNWLGVSYTTFVNSGSSANLLMLATLIEDGLLEPGDAVIVPALSWATDLAPVIQLGLQPVLCDCNLDDLSLDLDHLEQLCEEGYIVEKEGIKNRLFPKAVILVHVLGLIPDMDRIMEICDTYDLVLLEDCCEAMGSTFRGQKLGTFGLMSSFSSYFGHHISTIEGGMVCTNSLVYDRLLKSIRSHGWSRDWDKVVQEKYGEIWDVSEFDSLYTFYYTGFNVRATDLQAFLGLRQLQKLDEICEARYLNFYKYNDLLDIVSDTVDRGITSSFAIPIISENRDKIVEVLQENNVEVRPLICGSMGTQPFYVKKYGEQILPNAEYVKQFGLYLPNHHLLTNEDIDFICSLIGDLV